MHPDSTRKGSHVNRKSVDFCVIEPISQVHLILHKLYDVTRSLAVREILVELEEVKSFML